jgi:hypothetical protein
MLLLFNKIPVTLEVKLKKMVENAKSTLGSDFYNLAGSPWFGDKLTVKSLFPNWIYKESIKDPSNVLIVKIIQSYLRWLFSEKYGYGGKIDWENIQCPWTINDKFLEGLSDKYFPYEDFSEGSVLRDLLPNIKKFAINCDENYYNMKGSCMAVKYLLTTLINLPIDQCDVQTGSPGFMIVRANVPEKYKPFLNRSVYPAGTYILYETP